MRQMIVHRRVVVSLLVLVLIAFTLSACESTKWGALESTIRVEKASMVSYRDTVKSLHAEGRVTDAQRDEAKALYTKWQTAHNAAMNALTDLQEAVKAGEAINEDAADAEIIKLRDAALQAIGSFTTFLKTIGVL